MPGQPGRKAFPESGMKPTRPACSDQDRGPSWAHLLPMPTQAAPKTASQDPFRLLPLRYCPRQQAHPKVNPIFSSPSQHAPHQVRKSHKTHHHQSPPEQAVTQHYHADSHTRTFNFTSQVCSKQDSQDTFLCLTNTHAQVFLTQHHT